MSLCKTSGLAIFAVICLLGATTGSARAQCFLFEGVCATEWSGGRVIDLEGLPGLTSSSASGINNVGQAVGGSAVGGTEVATEWSGSIGAVSST